MQNRFENSTIIATIKGLIKIQFSQLPEKTLNALVEALTIDEGTPGFMSQLYNYCLALYAYGQSGPEGNYSRTAIFELKDALTNVTLTPDDNDNVHFNSTAYPEVNVLQAEQMKGILSPLNQTAITHYLNPEFENSTFVALAKECASEWQIETYIPTGVFDSQEFERTIRKLRYLVQERFPNDPALADFIFEEILTRKISLQQELEWKTSLLQSSIRDLENGAYDSLKPQAALETANAEDNSTVAINSTAPQVSSLVNLFMPLTNTSQSTPVNALPASTATHASSASVLFEMLAVVGVVGYLLLRFKPVSSLLKNSWFSTSPHKMSRAEYAAIESSPASEEDLLIKPSKYGNRYT